MLSTSINSHLRQGHQFKVKTFDKPKNCEHCTSVMIGSRRQGTICDQCHFTCHVHCARNAMNICPIPEEGRANKGFKIKEGVGTAYDGVIKVPKPGGVKKGWVRMKMTLCDFKIYRVFYLKCRFLGKKASYWVEKGHLGHFWAKISHFRSFLGQKASFQLIFGSKTSF